MIDTYKKIFKPASTCGMLGGAIIIIFFFIRRAFSLPAYILFTANCIVTILLMVMGVYFYRKKMGVIGFTFARELSFLIYVIILIILSFIRIIDGYFSKFSLPAVILGLGVIVGLGRILSHVIGMIMYDSNKKNNFS